MSNLPLAQGDTTRNEVGVLDRKGDMQIVRGSGFRVTLPIIPGVGALRTRYPIMPIHEEGSTAFKHLSALQVLYLCNQHFKRYISHTYTIFLSLSLSISLYIYIYILLLDYSSICLEQTFLRQFSFKSVREDNHK